MIHFLCNSKQNTVAGCNPNLREHCILTRSIERLMCSRCFIHLKNIPPANVPYRVLNGQVGVFPGTIWTTVVILLHIEIS